MKRIATITKLKPGMKDEYQKLHNEIWEDMVNAGHKYNMRNFSIFWHEDYLFSYFEYIGDNYEEDMQKKNSLPVTQKWRAATGAMTDYVINETKLINLEEIWHEEF